MDSLLLRDGSRIAIEADTDTVDQFRDCLDGTLTQFSAITDTGKTLVARADEVAGVAIAGAAMPEGQQHEPYRLYMPEQRMVLRAVHPSFDDVRAALDQAPSITVVLAEDGAALHVRSGYVKSLLSAMPTEAEAAEQPGAASAV